MYQKKPPQEIEMFETPRTSMQLAEMARIIAGFKSKLIPWDMFDKNMQSSLRIHPQPTGKTCKNAIGRLITREVGLSIMKLSRMTQKTRTCRIIIGN
jgi:hypothetical protein